MCYFLFTFSSYSDVSFAAWALLTFVYFLGAKCAFFVNWLASYVLQFSIYTVMFVIRWIRTTTENALDKQILTFCVFLNGMLFCTPDAIISSVQYVFVPFTTFLPIICSTWYNFLLYSFDFWSIKNSGKSPSVFQLHIFDTATFVNLPFVF